MSLAPNDPRHGTPNGYTNLKCRCDACRKAQSAYMRARGIGPYRRNACPECGRPKWFRSERCQGCANAARYPEHGTESMYVKRGCRCDACTTAANDARRIRRLTPNVKVHGAAGYSNGCRCAVCLAGQLEKNRIWRAKRRTAA